MQVKSNNDIENIIRMREIAHIYALTNQRKKSEMYHENIIKITSRYPNDEKMLTLKMESLNQLNRKYKSLQATEKLLDLNPYSIAALINITRHMKEEEDV